MRRLIVCADGTWNRPDEAKEGVETPTNVVKLARALGVPTDRFAMCDEVGGDEPADEPAPPRTPRRKRRTRHAAPVNGSHARASRARGPNR